MHRRAAFLSSAGCFITARAGEKLCSVASSNPRLAAGRRRPPLIGVCCGSGEGPGGVEELTALFSHESVEDEEAEAPASAGPPQ